jgi:hypothetical protein
MSGFLLGGSIRGRPCPAPESDPIALSSIALSSITARKPMPARVTATLAKLDKANTLSTLSS